MIHKLNPDAHANILIAAGCSPQTAVAQAALIKQARLEVGTQIMRALHDIPLYELQLPLPEVKEKFIKLVRDITK